jgi:hypothetical protein
MSYFIPLSAATILSTSMSAVYSVELPQSQCIDSVTEVNYTKEWTDNPHKKCHEVIRKALESQEIVVTQSWVGVSFKQQQIRDDLKSKLDELKARQKELREKAMAGEPSYVTVCLGDLCVERTQELAYIHMQQTILDLQEKINATYAIEEKAKQDRQLYLDSLKQEEESAGLK